MASYVSPNAEDCVRRNPSRSRQRLPNSDSEGSIKQFLDSTPTPEPAFHGHRFPNSNSAGSIGLHPELSPTSSYAMLDWRSKSQIPQQRRYSDGHIKLPKISTAQHPSHTKTKSLDESSRPRKKKHSKSGGGKKSRGEAGGMEGGESRRSSNSHSRSSSLGSITSQTTEETFTDTTTEFEALQPVYESPEIPQSPMPPGLISPSSNAGPRELELFYNTTSTQVADDESMLSLAPTQETIEGAGMYDANINRLPESGIEEAEDRELTEFSNILKEASAMIIQDNMERVGAQYSKVINKYREQYRALQEEHQQEKSYLEKQIEMEKSRNREGVVIQRLMGVRLEENRADMKFQTETLQHLRQQFQTKKEQVADLRERLHQSEDELKTVRNSLAEQKRKTSELVPMPPGHAQRKLLEIQETTQPYLDSMLRLMPEEKLIKEELAKRRRLLQGRPITTGMLHKEPSASRVLSNEGNTGDTPPRGDTTPSCSTSSAPRIGAHSTPTSATPPGSPKTRN